MQELMCFSALPYQYIESFANSGVARRGVIALPRPFPCHSNIESHMVWLMYENNNEVQLASHYSKFCRVFYAQEYIMDKCHC